MISNSKKDNTYQTADLGIAVYLFTHDHQLVETTLLSPKRLIFHFKKQKNTETLVGLYLNGTGQAPAKRLFDNYRALRALAFQGTGNLR